MTDWTLITFDIDGTLLKASGPNANARHRDAFVHAGLLFWREEYGEEQVRDAFERSWDCRPSQGATDGIIVLLFAKELGISEELMKPRVAEFFDKMAEFFAGEVENMLEGIELLAGVKPAMEKLALRERTAFGLVTGNVEKIAWVKMKALGLPLAPSQGIRGGFGGFGSDVMPSGIDGKARGTDRGEQILVAKANAQKLLPEGHTLTRSFHVGDTHADIDAAVFAKSIPIAVTTGKFSADELGTVLPTNGAVLDCIDSDGFWNMLNAQL